MFSAIISSILAFAALICAVVAAMKSEWLVAADGLASTGMFHYCGAVGTDACGTSVWFVADR